MAIRHGLAEGYRRLEELSREWNEEMRGDNHTVMEQIELREADERGKLMRQAAALYERKTGGRLPGDYLEAVKAERALLHGSPATAGTVSGKYRRRRWRSTG